MHNVIPSQSFRIVYKAPANQSRSVQQRTIAVHGAISIQHHEPIGKNTLFLCYACHGTTQLPSRIHPAQSPARNCLSTGVFSDNQNLSFLAQYISGKVVCLLPVSPEIHLELAADFHMPTGEGYQEKYVLLDYWSARRAWQLDCERFINHLGDIVSAVLN
ncbi:hypothetical protein T265_14486, partial [Opisthorchis viverrini]